MRIYLFLFLTICSLFQNEAFAESPASEMSHPVQTRAATAKLPYLTIITASNAYIELSDGSIWNIPWFVRSVEWMPGERVELFHHINNADELGRFWNAALWNVDRKEDRILTYYDRNEDSPGIARITKLEPEAGLVTLSNGAVFKILDDVGYIYTDTAEYIINSSYWAEGNIIFIAKLGDTRSTYVFQNTSSFYFITSEVKCVLVTPPNQ
jgi:hypothetical protein